MNRFNLTKEQRAELLIRAKILDEDGNYHKDYFSKETVEKSKARKQPVVELELRKELDDLKLRVEKLEQLVVRSND